MHPEDPAHRMAKVREALAREGAKFGPVDSQGRPIVTSDESDTEVKP